MRLSFTTDYNRFIEEIDKSEVVSFDFFDTMACRPFAKPSDLFALMEGHLIRNIGGQYKGFAYLRTLAEELARRQAQKSGFQETTIDEIYEKLSDIFAENNVDCGNLVKQLEIDLETSFVSYAGSKVFELYNYALSKNKTVLIVSDIYLSKIIMEDIIWKCGYTGPHKLFLSSEHRLSKYTGDIFLYISAVLDIKKPEDVLHIGDNEHSDLSMPISKGWRAIQSHTPLYERYLAYQFHGSIHFDPSNLFKSASLGLFQRHNQDIHAKNNHLDYMYLLGWCLIAPLMISLARWINLETREWGAEKILFLARDGQLVSKVYKAIYEKFPSGLPSDYCYASRRMISLPTSSVNGHQLYLFYEDVIKECINFGALASALPNGYKFISKSPLSEISPREPLKNNKTNQNLVKNVFISHFRIILESFEDERTHLIEYFKHLTDGCKTIAVFDIGWHGSLQRGIQKIIEPTVAVNGVYFGLKKQAFSLGSLSKMKGFFLHYGRPHDNAHASDQATELFELFFYADHPSIERVLKQQDGSFCPVVLPAGDVERSRIELARTIHRSVMDHVELALSTFDEEQLDIIYHKDEIVDALAEFVHRPQAVDAKQFVGVEFASAIGADRGAPLIDSRVLENSSAIAGLKASRWKSGAKAINRKPKGWRRLTNKIYTFQRDRLNGVVKKIKGKA